MTEYWNAYPETVPVPHPIYCHHGIVVGWRYDDPTIPISRRYASTCWRCKVEDERDG